MQKKLLVLLFIMVIMTGCSKERRGLGSDVYNELGVNKYTVEDTEEDFERNYDAITLLKRGEAYYDKEKYIEARGEYERFLQLHPFHKYVPHVYYRIATSYYREFTRLDRNPEPLENSLAYYEKLVENFPESEYAKAAEKKIRILKERLAEKELLIGKFYYKKDSYDAGIGRFLKVVNNYPNTGACENALYFLSLSYNKKGDEANYKEYYNQLASKYPDSGLIKKLQDIR